MKNKKTIKIIIAVFIMLFFVLINKSFGADFSGNFSKAYLMSGDWIAYCREHGKALSGCIGNLKIKTVHYSETSGPQHVEPATGYAYYCGAREETLQRVIWYSKNWTGGTNSVVDADSKYEPIDSRYKAYGDVYYGIIKPYMSQYGDPEKATANLFTVVDTNKDNIKVMVNQQNKKYIVGPYKIALNFSDVANNNNSQTINKYVVDQKTDISDEEKSLTDTLNGVTEESKGTFSWNNKPTITNTYIQYGDVRVNRKNVYYDGDTFVVPKGAANINGTSIQESSSQIMKSIKSQYNEAIDNLDEDDKESKAQIRRAYRCLKDSSYYKYLAFIIQDTLIYENNHQGEGISISKLTSDLEDYIINIAGSKYYNDKYDYSFFSLDEDIVLSAAREVSTLIGQKSNSITTSFDDDKFLITSKSNYSGSSKYVYQSSSSSANSSQAAKEILDNEDQSINDYSSTVYTNSKFNVSDVAKKELYNELINWKNINKPFATFNISKDLQGINGEDKSYRLLDENGNEIQFPDFVNQKPFYIEFTPKNDGNIQYIGSPNFVVHLLTDFKYTVNGIYEMTSVTSGSGRFTPGNYTVISDNYVQYTNSSNCYFEKESVISVPIKAGKHKTIVGYQTYTVTFYTTSGHKVYYYSNGHRHFDYWELNSGASWKMQSKTSWTAQVGPKPWQRINGEITEEAGVDSNSVAESKQFSSHLTNAYANNVEIGGTVWLENPDVKTAEVDGKYGSNGDSPFAGIQVQLYDVTDGNTAVLSGDGNQGKLVAITTTDKNGHYRFYGVNNKATDKNGQNLQYFDESGTKHQMYELLINPLHKYYVTFVYNGQMYQPTYYKKQLTSPGYSNAKDMSREIFNAKFTVINPDSANYNSPATNSGNRAYSYSHKLKDGDGNYIAYSSSQNVDADGNSTENNSKSTALTYGDAWNQFVIFATNTRNFDLNPKRTDGNLNWGNVGNSTSWISTYTKGGSYSNSQSIAIDNSNYQVALGKLDSWLKVLNVSDDERKNVATFIQDSMMVSTTLQENKAYPFDTNKFENYTIENIENPEENSVKLGNAGTYPYLYRPSTDQSRWVDFGLCNREVNDLALGKDLYKVTFLVNGKKETYEYNKKDLDENGTWRIKDRAGNGLFNSADYYKRPIRSSEYLYDESDSYGDNSDIKNLQAWVTYKIIIKNQGMVDVDLTKTEVVDYFDNKQYSFDGDLNGDTYTLKQYSEYNYSNSQTTSYVNSYIGADGKGNRKYGLTDTTLQVKTKGIDSNHETITGSNYNYNTIYLSGLKSSSGKDADADLLHPGQLSYVYVTFKVNNDGNTNKIFLDQEISNGEITIGKMNIAEINSYSTKYMSGQTIPDYLDENDKKFDSDVSSKVAGLVDTDSNPGSLSSKDLNNDGNIIVDKEHDYNNRLEDDTDKAPNIKFTIDTGNVRKFTGMVYEDNRTVKSGNAMIGNGIFDGKDTKINGVTVQLVELVQEVDKNTGFATGSYLGEKVWSSYQYKQVNSNGNFEDDNFVKVDYSRYYSGSDTKKTKVIISGPDNTILHVDAESLSGNDNVDGLYGFTSIPTGDFYIRFIYGDTTQTTLTNGSDSNNIGSKEVNELVGDLVDGYKGLNAKSYNGQDYKSTVYQKGINQEGGFNNGVNAYTNYDIQNYGKVDDADSVVNGNVQMIVNSKATDKLYGSSNIGEEKTSSDGKYQCLLYKNKMYYYNIANSGTEEANKNHISDAKDVYDYRQIGNNYASNNNVNDNGIANSKDEKGVLNNKAEILRSFDTLATYKSGNAQTDRSTQIDMIRNFMNNTRMVAQTGVINIEVESNTQNTSSDAVKKDDDNYHNEQSYVITDVDLGLVERPRAQLKLNKEITNFRVTLANGQILFDTNKSVKDLTYSKHTGHQVTYTDGNLRLEKVKVSSNSRETPELVQLYMDDELLEGATMNALYKLTVTNVGEVDYLDKQFYYTGNESNTNINNVSRTNAVDVIDYVANNIIFNKNNNNQWEVTSAKELTNSSSYGNDGTIQIDNTNNQISNDFVNRYYFGELSTYNTLIHTTNGLKVSNSSNDGSDKYNQGLLPEMLKSNEEPSSVSTTLELSTLLSSNTSGDNLIYNNLSEITATTNSQGRRMQFSIVGNQKMADQKLGNNASQNANSSDDLVTPSEIDADSSQKIVIMPPTGANKNYIPLIIATLIGVIAIIITAYFLKNKPSKKEEQK